MECFKHVFCMIKTVLTHALDIWKEKTLGNTLPLHGSPSTSERPIRRLAGEPQRARAEGRPSPRAAQCCLRVGVAVRCQRGAR
eukprot:3479248-Pyramimonas_sp.AAC.1